jgi:hypothetical protein
MTRDYLDSKWMKTVEERLMLGITIFPGDSDFLSSYSCVCTTMKKDEVEEVFERYGITTIYKRKQKIKKIKSRI